MINREKIQSIIQRYRDDSESVYNTWFKPASGARQKAFSGIRRGVEQVVKDIKDGVFYNDFKDSSLERVLMVITEQKEVFKGAAHPFYWKPKLRIPDIYEDDENKRVFGQFLESCLNADDDNKVLTEIIKLEKQNIKGLGPSLTNILYFLHPQKFPPFNTAMVNGFNKLFGEKKKLGSWDSYREMRNTILHVNDQFKNLLSKDLGAISGLLFDIGVGLIDTDGVPIEEEVRRKLEKERMKRHQEREDDVDREKQHSEMEYRLMEIGGKLDCDVIAASNDRSKSYNSKKFSFLPHSLLELPELDFREDIKGREDIKKIKKGINFIDIIWLERDGAKIVCAYEVEKSTSITSGITRLTDLALALSDSKEIRFYLVIPDEREEKAKSELKRLHTQNDNIKISYILFSDLCEEGCSSICKFGEDHTVMEKVARYVG